MLLFRRGSASRDVQGPPGLIPPRPTIGSGTSAASVTNDTALRHSAVWACLRLRADLISTFPVDVYRKVAGIQVEMPKPPVLVSPGGERVPMIEWLYSSQVDLDRAGNAIGLITERNAAGLPARIDLQPIGSCSIRERDGQLRYRIGRKDYSPDQVWHERQYTVPGLPVGLSPIAYAAWSVAEGLSIQDFALTWFGGGGNPRAHLRNTKKPTVPSEDAALVKERFRASVHAGDVFVSGMDWEYKPIQAEQTGMEWLAARSATSTDIARFLGCPGDLIDAAVKGESITYANITQRNLQFLIYHLGPAVVRREARLSQLLPRPRFVKLNTSALLRMDDETRARMVQAQIASRVLAPSEARALENRPPLTPEQIEEFTVLFGAPRTAPVSATSSQGA